MNDEEPASKQRIGRPPKYLSEGLRRTHSLRFREPVRDRLMAAARRSGLSMSEEVERRVEESFDDVAAVGRVVGHLLKTAEGITGQSWHADVGTRDLALDMIIRRLQAMRDDPVGVPQGEEARRARDYLTSIAWRDPDTSREATLQPVGKPEWGETEPKQPPKSSAAA